MPNLLTPLTKRVASMPWVARNSHLVTGPDRLLLRLTRGRIWPVFPRYEVRAGRAIPVFELRL